MGYQKLDYLLVKKAGNGLNSFNKLNTCCRLFSSSKKEIN
jgi:hypothetical protein